LGAVSWQNPSEVSHRFKDEAIWDYTAEDSLDAADRWILKLREAFDLLAKAPGLGHVREDLTALPVRFWPMGDYLVIYRMQPTRIEIVAVTQGSRDLPTFLQTST
jgi:plasmid stabilization system protein ParE